MSGSAEQGKLNRGKALRWGVGCLIAAAAGVIALHVVAEHTWRKGNEPYYSRARSIQLGMMEADVRARLGEPSWLYEAGTAPEDYYVTGYTYQRREISSKVLIYFGGMDMIVYVYLDRDGRVEHVFIGGS